MAGWSCCKLLLVLATMDRLMPGLHAAADFLLVKIETNTTQFRQRSASATTPQSGRNKERRHVVFTESHQRRTYIKSHVGPQEAVTSFSLLLGRFFPGPEFWLSFHDDKIYSRTQGSIFWTKNMPPLSKTKIFPVPWKADFNVLLTTHFSSRLPPILQILRTYFYLLLYSFHLVFLSFFYSTYSTLFYHPLSYSFSF
jgi:hypothetical protein